MRGKFIIYQILLRAFGNRECIPGGSYIDNGSGKFNDIDENVLEKLKKLSIGAVWYTGIISHATTTSFGDIKGNDKSIVKGEAGSPFAIRDYYDVDPALAVSLPDRMKEFESLIERTHNAGMKVIIDFVPNHVFRAYESSHNSFDSSNFYPLSGELVLPEEIRGNYRESPAFASGNDCFSTHPSVNDWYDTVKLNYQNRDTWNKMLNILDFWASKGVDAFRCDMVEMVPVEFFSWAFTEIRKKYSQLKFIAEIYNKDNYRKYAEAGFDFLYDKSGFYDTLRQIMTSSRPASSLTGEWRFLGDLQPRMLNFLENHDEHRLSSDFFIGSAIKSIPAVMVSLLFNTAPFMLYFGQEFGERGMESEGFSGIDGRTSIYDYCTVPSIKRWLSDKLTEEENSIYKEYQKLLKMAVEDDLFRFGETYELIYANPQNDDKKFAFIRKYKERAALVVADFGSETGSEIIMLKQD